MAGDLWNLFNNVICNMPTNLAIVDHKEHTCSYWIQHPWSNKLKQGECCRKSASRYVTAANMTTYSLYALTVASFKDIIVINITK